MQEKSTRPRLEESLYRPEAVRFQRFRMIGDPPLAAPRIGRGLMIGIGGLALCAGALATGSHRQTLAATVRDASASAITVAPAFPNKPPAPNTIGEARDDHGFVAKVMVLPSRRSAAGVRFRILARSAGKVPPPGARVQVVFDRQALRIW